MCGEALERQFIPYYTESGAGQCLPWLLCLVISPSAICIIMLFSHSQKCSSPRSTTMKIIESWGSIIMVNKNKRKTSHLSETERQTMI